MNQILNNKKLLVLGGTRISCDIILKAKEMGVKVAVADYNDTEHSPGKQIADETYLVSVLDVDAVVKIINENHIDGVITGFSDMLLPYYADICKKAGLPCYGTKEQFEIFSNKDRYKSLLKKYDIPTIEDYSISLDSFEQDVENIKFPVLVKPADGSVSRGISICKDKIELKTAMNKAAKYSKSGKMIVERYVDAEETTVFWIFNKGKYYISALGNRHIKANQGDVLPLPVGYTFPASVLPSYMKNIVPNCKKLFSELEVQDGMMFMQCKVEDNTCVVYDIGFRLTGSLEYKLLSAISGYDPLEMLINHALTGEMTNLDLDTLSNPYFNKYGYNVSILAKPGKIESIEGLNEARTIPGVLDVVVAHLPGETITEDMKGLLAQITVRVLGYANSEKEMIEKMKKIEDTIKIISDKNEIMNLPGIEESDVHEKLILI